MNLAGGITNGQSVTALDTLEMVVHVTFRMLPRNIHFTGKETEIKGE